MSILPRRPLLVVGVSAAVGLLVAGSTILCIRWLVGDSASPVRASAGSSAAADNVYAFTTSTSLRLVDGAQVRLTAQGVFDGPPQWTRDGRWVYAVSRIDAADGISQIVAVQAATLQVRAVGCECGPTVASIGDAGIIWNTPDDGLMRVDLDVVGPETADPRALPPAPDVVGRAPNVEAAVAGDDLLVEQDLVASASILLSSFYIVDAGGGITYVEKESGTVGRVVVDDSHQPEVAYVATDKADACVTTDKVSVLMHLADAPERTDMAAVLAPHGAHADGDSVTDLWWARDHHLYATMSSWTCDDAANATMLLPPQLWRLDGTRWVAADSEPAAEVRLLGPNTRALVAADKTLYFEQGAVRTRVASHILGISIGR